MYSILNMYNLTNNINNENIIEVKDTISQKNLINVFIKCLMIGSSGVGKSSILERYSSNNFYSHFITTIGVDYKIKNIIIDNHNIKLQLWDTASQERFRCMTNNYYRNSHIIILCYDITDAHSFSELDFWINDAKKHLTEPILMAICGTKSDLEDRRVISYEDGKNYADYKNLPYFEISSKNNVGLTNMFETLIKMKISEPDFIKITTDSKIIEEKEKYDVVKINYISNTNYYRDESQCCYLY